MPTYVYRCRKCKHRFELFHGIRDESVKRCPRCGAKAERVPAGGAGIIFKGSGFYITDYRSKSYREKARKETPDASKGGAAGGSSSGTPGGSSSETSGGSSSSRGSSSTSGGSPRSTRDPSAGAPGDY